MARRAKDDTAAAWTMTSMISSGPWVVISAMELDEAVVQASRKL